MTQSLSQDERERITYIEGQARRRARRRIVRTAMWVGFGFVAVALLYVLH